MKSCEMSPSPKSASSPSPPLPWLSRTFSSTVTADTDITHTTKTTNTSNATKTTDASPTSPTSPIDLQQYHTAPQVTSNTILLIGLTIYLLSLLSPALLLLITFLLSRWIPQLYRVNDDGETRRRMWKEFVEGRRKSTKSAKSEGEVSSDDSEVSSDDGEGRDGHLICEEHGDGFVRLMEGIRCGDEDEDLDLEERYWVNDRGMCLLTSIMKPKSTKPRAIICYCHGFQGSSALLARREYKRFVAAGMAVVSLDYEGHGRSDGKLGLIPCWEWLVDDVSRFFEETCGGSNGREEFRGVPRFLSGESMGGAVAFSTYQRNPSFWRGVLFVAPMCKIKEEMLPPKWVTEGFRTILGPSGTATLFGQLPIAPVSNKFEHYCFKEDVKRDFTHLAPYSYGRKPRLATGRELINTTASISSSLDKFDAPFLIQHGKDDKITCPQLSEALYQESPSKDKEIKLYEGMWHTITAGESDKNIDIVFNDAIRWVADRI